MSEGSQRPLRVLVVEDEFLIAAEMVAMLEEAGHEVIGPASSVAAAQTLLADSPALDVAVIDANLRGETSAPIAERMRDLNVPFCVCTGYRIADLKAQFGDVVTLQKPIDPAALVRTVASLGREKTDLR